MASIIPNCSLPGMPDEIRVIVKKGAKKAGKNEGISYDSARGAYVVWVSANREKGRANAELVSIMSKKLGKSVRIKSGFTSKTKILCISE